MKSFNRVLWTIGILFALKTSYAQTPGTRVPGKAADSTKANNTKVNSVNADSAKTANTKAVSAKTDSSAKVLHQVIVTAPKNYIEQKIDRTVVNVGALLSNTGANALEVLEKAPGVIVDGNGTISFKGKSGVLVLIDDKPTYLSAANLATYLRSLPSSSLEKIELMDNPPARYDAAGNAGVINIRTKKSTLVGLNGTASASYGQAIYGQTNESLNLNYRVGKINIFANVAYSYRKSWRRLDIDRNYFNATGDLSSSFRQSSYFRPSNSSPNLKLGMDYSLSPQTTWGIVLTGSLSPRKDESPVFSFLYDQGGKPDSSITALNTTHSTFSNGGVNLNYNHRFDSAGKSISFDLDYVHYHSGSDQAFLNNTLYPDGSPKDSQTILDSLPSIITIYSAKMDYTLPLKGKAKLEAGVKSSYVSTDNTADYFNVFNNISMIDTNNTNRFLYKENINAAYINYNKSWSRFSLQAGLRVENTNAWGHQLGNVVKPDSSFSNHYSNLFPTAYLSYKLNEKGNDLLILSYGRRIGRPFYQDLNPFITLLDKFTYFAGNPFLKPQFSGNYKLSYSYKNFLTVALQYNKTTDVQTETIEQSGPLFISRTGNIGERINYGLSINAGRQATPWWSFNIYSEVFSNTFKGALYTGYLDRSAVYCLVNATNQFTLPKGWSTELGGIYISRRVNGQFINNATWLINAGLQKKVLHNKGAVRLNVRDIFHTFSSSGVIDNIPNATANYRNYLDSQVATISFSYTFGKQNNAVRKRNVGSESEQGRVKD